MTADSPANGSPEGSQRSYAKLAPAAPDGPLNLSKIFPQHSEIELEIGFGRGMFLLERARVVPETCMLGLEIKRKWAYLVSERARRRELDNVVVMAGDVRMILPRMEPAGAVTRCYLHFPDPWWKKRHAKRRLLDQAILDEVARLLGPEGEFFIQTDVAERAQAYRDVLERHSCFRLEPGEARNIYGAMSNREKRAIEDGLPVYRILAHRCGAPAAR